MPEPFGATYQRLSSIYECQQQLHTKLTDLDDKTQSTRIMGEASRWIIGTSAEHE